METVDWEWFLPRPRDGGSGRSNWCACAAAELLVPRMAEVSEEEEEVVLLLELGSHWLLPPCCLW